MMIDLIEPRREIAGELERGKRIARGAMVFVDSEVARATDPMKEIADLRRQDRTGAQDRKHVIEGRRAAGQDRVRGGNLFCHQFSERAQLYQGGGSVLAEIAFSERRQPKQAIVRLFQKLKVR